MRRQVVLVFLVLMATMLFASCGTEKEVASPMVMHVAFEKGTMDVTLLDNASGKALYELLQKGPLNISCSNYGGFEKVAKLGHSLPSSDVYLTTAPGDVCLYLGNQIVFFHGNNSWEYTRLGAIRDYSEKKKDLLSGTDHNITLSI